MTIFYVNILMLKRNTQVAFLLNSWTGQVNLAHYNKYYYIYFSSANHIDLDIVKILVLNIVYKEETWKII